MRDSPEETENEKKSIIMSGQEEQKRNVEKTIKFSTTKLVGGYPRGLRGLNSQKCMTK